MNQKTNDARKYVRAYGLTTILSILLIAGTDTRLMQTVVQKVPGDTMDKTPQTKVCKRTEGESEECRGGDRRYGDKRGGQIMGD